MAAIRILPEIVSNKIAAGEVVERPASVVKELVENAIDAGSDRILVEIENGGRRLIRVSDNGCGMARDDALLALERYATSKIFADSDLFAIRTLGFRGEALPSIAAVSRFTLLTREAGAETGTQITVNGGKLSDVRAAGAPPGTLIEVRRLFFNTPARRKFLKSVNTEMGHIADTLSAMALAWPQTRFRLVHNGRSIRDWPSADAARRVADVLGREARARLVPVDARTPIAELAGWVCTSRISRATTRGIYIFVNGRFVRDRVIQHALIGAFRGRLMKGRYPLAVLFLKVPFDQVDVNVHPTKHQVRFARQREIHDQVARAVTQAIDAAERPAWGPRPPGGQANHRTGHVETPREGGAPPVFDRPPDRRRERQGPGPRPRGLGDETSGRPGAADARRVAEPRAPYPLSPSRAAAPVQTPVWRQSRFGDLRVIGQLRDTFILCEAPRELVVIDQHAAHERICYEELKRQATQQTPAAQLLAIPESIELSRVEAGLLTRLLPQLRRAGLDVEPFGETAFVVRAVPSLLTGCDIRSMLVEMAEKMASDGLAASSTHLSDDVLKLMACHGAIRASQRLDAAEISAMLKRLDACDDPAHCPHGRPTWIRFSLKFLQKSFGRIVHSGPLAPG